MVFWGRKTGPLGGGRGGTRAPPGGKGGSERGSNRRPSSKTSARAIRGNSPPEEGGATLATSEGPICYRQTGGAPTDGRRPFDSLRSLRPFDVSLEAMSEAAKRTSRMVQVLHRATTL